MPAIEVEAPKEPVKQTNPEIEIERPRKTEEKEGELPPPRNPKTDPKELVFSDPFAQHDERNQQGMPNLPGNDRTPVTRPRPEST